MIATPRTSLLLGDAVERVLASPDTSHAWHRLLACYEAENDAAARTVARGTLSAQAPAEGVAGFLRATFLAGVTGEIGHVAAAGDLLQHIRPCDPERLMAFANFEWGRALARDGDRAQFVAHLRAARLPEIMALAGRHLAGRGARRPPARRIVGLRRVALVASFIGAAGHTPSALALAHARILRDLGVAVHVFAAQELLVADMPHYLGNMGRVTTPAPQVEELATTIPSGIEVTLVDDRFSLMRRWQDMLSAIADFDPDMVLFVGLNSPLVTPLHAARPVLGLCVHSVAPMAPVDAWLTATAALAGEHATPLEPALPPAWGHHHPFRIALKPAGVALDRAALAIDEDDIVLVTVGARLAAEIAGPWAARMCALLADAAHLVWLLVGGQGDLPPALAGVSTARLRTLAHRDDLRGVLRSCDVYVNPPRLGGGFSVAEAMAEGLPTLAFADSDGGNKLGPHAVADIDTYFARLRALVDQPAARAAAGAAMRALFATTLDLECSGPSLLRACGVAQSRFTARMATDGPDLMRASPATG